MQKKSGKKLNLNLKEFDKKFLDLLYQTIEKQTYSFEIFCTGVTAEHAYKMQNRFQKTPCFLNENLNIFFLCSHKYAECVLKKVMDCGTCGINFNFPFVSRAIVEVFHNKGYPVCAWTLETAKTMQNMMNMHVDSITTRQVVFLKAFRPS